MNNVSEEGNLLFSILSLLDFQNSFLPFLTSYSGKKGLFLTREKTVRAFFKYFYPNFIDLDSEIISFVMD